MVLHESLGRRHGNQCNTFCAGCIARGSGFVLNICFTILLNPINRTLMDWLCRHRINTIVPINTVIYFFVGIAMLACVASLFHGVGALTQYAAKLYDIIKERWSWSWFLVLVLGLVLGSCSWFVFGLGSNNRFEHDPFLFSFLYGSQMISNTLTVPLIICEPYKKENKIGSCSNRRCCISVDRKQSRACYQSTSPWVITLFYPNLILPLTLVLTVSPPGS